MNPFAVQIRRVHEIVQTIRSRILLGHINRVTRSCPDKKNVVAFSLWGDAPCYWVGALRNIELAREFYPGWFCRFYVDAACPRDLIESLRGDRVEVVLQTRKAEFDGMFWRFLAAADPDVNVAVFRDCDSRIGLREAVAVGAWLGSSADFHIMRDHPWHGTQMLGGMWGCRAHAVSDIEQLMSKWTVFDHKGCDQEFLAEHVYPRARQRALEHSEFQYVYDNPTRRFPLPRRQYEFVGEVFDEHDNRNLEHRTIIVEAMRRRGGA